MPSKEKIEKVEEIRNLFTDSDSFVVIHYKGLRVAESNELRAELKKAGAKFKVLKNTLTRIALSGTPREQAISLIEGPIAVAFTKEDLLPVARAIREFARGKGEIYFKGGMMGERMLSASDVEKLATLPPREVLIARAIGQVSGLLSGFVGVCAGPLRKFVGVMNAIASQREGSFSA